MKIRLITAVATMLFTGYLTAGENQKQDPTRIDILAESSSEGSTVPHEEGLFESTSKERKGGNPGSSGVDTKTESSEEGATVPHDEELFESTPKHDGSVAPGNGSNDVDTTVDSPEEGATVSHEEGLFESTPK